MYGMQSYLTMYNFSPSGKATLKKHRRNVQQLVHIILFNGTTSNDLTHAYLKVAMRVRIPSMATSSISSSWLSLVLDFFFAAAQELSQLLVYLFEWVIGLYIPISFAFSSSLRHVKKPDSIFQANERCTQHTRISF